MIFALPALQGTLGNVCRHFLLSCLGAAMPLLLAPRDAANRLTMHKMVPHNKDLFTPKCQQSGG